MKYILLKIKMLTATALLFGAMTLSFSTPIFAADKLYDQVSTQVITKGVTYEKNHRLTAEGWQDIYVMKIDLNDPNIEFSAVESSAEYGLKETVIKLLSDKGAVAGVNASFFGMKGNYSSSFGVTMDEGKLISVGTDINSGDNQYASFFVDKQGEPFLHFLKTDLQFYNNGQSFFDIVSVNKVTDMIYPIYFDRNAATSTASLDARFPDLAKIVVEDGIITKISAKGEIIDVPENGYLIIMSGTTYDYNVQNFQVGQTAEFKVSATLDLNQIDTAVSGAGLILDNGAQVGAPGQVAAGRQPRTALGISQDKNTLIIMAVDGRGDSIGATQTEMAYLMLEYGAFNAMHFDGGGSTTLAAKTIDDAALEVKNQVSDGAERKVINAFGIFNNGPVGALSQIVLKPATEKVFLGDSTSLEVIGYDEYFHRVDVPISEVQFTSTDLSALISANQYTPLQNGNAVITASYQGLTAAATIEGMTIQTLAPDENAVTVGVGESRELRFSGTSTDGYKAPVNMVTLSSELIEPNGRSFIAHTAGSGMITASFGGASCFVKLSAGGISDVNPAPVATPFIDSKKTAITGKEEGYTYINMVGRVASASEEVKANPAYIEARGTVNQALTNNADLAVYVGANDMTLQNNVETIQWNSGYSFYDKGVASIVQMTAANGTPRKTNTWQWQAFKNDILKSPAKHVIFIIDKTPSNFTDRLESALFTSVLAELDKEGKEIFVVSSGDGSSWDSVKDGVRYINLPNLWNADGSLNQNFQLLTFKVNGDTISYDIKKAF